MMLTTEDSSLVRRRAVDAKRLHEDFSGLIADAHLEQSGKTIRYAVDQSEIYSYVFPESTAPPLRIFSDDDDQRTVAVQHYVLNKLFHGLTHELVLLPPYLRELQEFANKLRGRAFEGTIGLMPEIVTEARKVVRTEKFRAIEAEVSAMKGALHPDPATLKRTLEFLQKEAAHLLHLIDGTDTEPFNRLNTLLDDPDHDGHHRLLPLGALVPPGLRPDPDVISAWQERLNKERATRSGANENDARAMGYLAAANHWAQAERQNLAFRLITRSPHMLEIDRELASAGGSNGGTGGMLRHPRVFIALRRLEGRPGDSPAARLEIMQGSLELMVQAVEASPLGLVARAALPAPIDGTVSPAQPDSVEQQPSEEATSLTEQHVDTQQPNVEANELIAIISEQLDDGASLASIGAVSRNSPRKTQTTADIDRARVIRLFEMIRDEKKLLGEIESKVSTLADEMERNQQLMPVAVQGSSVDEVAPALVMETKNGRTVFGSDLYWMPYQLEFTDAKLAGWSTRLTENRPTKTSEILTGFQDGFERGLDYEVLLALANLLGALDQWKIARSYSDLALLQAGLKSPRLPSHEGKFFKAMCLRMLPRGLNEPAEMVARRYAEANALLDDVARNATGAGSRVDARYLIEKATVLLRWSRLEWDAPDALAEARARAHEREALRVAQDALRSAEVNVMQQALIYNNVCFHYLETDNASRVAEARSYLEKLLNLIDSQPLREWPPNFQDTVLVAQYKLKDQSPKREYVQKLYDALVEALDKRYRGVRPLDRERVQEHLREAKQMLASLGA